MNFGFFSTCQRTFFFLKNSRKPENKKEVALYINKTILVQSNIPKTTDYAIQMGKRTANKPLPVK